MNTYNVTWLDQLGINDIDRVGGKNASLGEMIQNLGNLGVNVPGGFATTADAYRGFLAHDDLGDKINALLDDLNVDDLDALAKTGKQIRDWLMNVPLQEDLENDINSAYAKLVEQYGEDVTWAVRSSATAVLIVCIKILTMRVSHYLRAFKKWFALILRPAVSCLH